MTEETKLACSVNHYYREGYEQGRADEKEESQITKEEYMGICSQAVGMFVAQCFEVAEKNWTPNQKDQLGWLFGSVLDGIDYADYAEQKLNQTNLLETLVRECLDAAGLEWEE